jgi:GT2 family glycosyltransferase
VLRNEQCPCGSGKRYKHCCGAVGTPTKSIASPAAASSASANVRAFAPPTAFNAQEAKYAALAHQQAGALTAAEHLYRRVLANTADDADCLHMLGAICYQSGRSWEAFDLITRALELTAWQFPTMRYNLGLVVAQLMRDLDGREADERFAKLQATSEQLHAYSRAAERHVLFEDDSPVTIPVVEFPEVSIVIPVHGEHRFTYSCVRSIVEQSRDVRFEVILVDDASPEPASTALAHVDGIRLIRNEANVGFIGSCNRGARQARGKVLVFLNNDTLVTAGWLPALLSALGAPEVGLVGAKLVYPDGALQEAGGILWQNGSASNYGRNDDASKPEYNYVRDVDYCSGACLAIRRDDFHALGGFDAHFSPAYYEDADLAMRVRRSGKRVVYQPAATIVHFEGVTSGRTLHAGVKRHQVNNQAKFLARWRDALEGHHAPLARAELAKDPVAKARVLVIDAYMPVPDKDAGSVRITAIMRLLVRAGCKVTFVAHSLEFAQGYGQQLQQAGIEVLHFPYVWSAAQILAQRGADLDVVWASRYEVASACQRAVRRYAPRALFVFDTVDLHFLREAREAELTGDPAIAQRAERTRHDELETIRNSDLTIVVSEAERDILIDAAPDASISVLSMIHEVPGRTKDFDARRGIFFIGGFRHPPNIDAIVWFANEIWPLIRARLPGVPMYVIGSNAIERVRALEGNGIEVVGHVPDLAPYLDGCRVSVAPLRFGAGVKGKITSAQASGVPVVATTLATEGMHLEHGRDVLVADSPQAFADAVVRLYTDAALWTSISDGSVANMARRFSAQAAAGPLADVIRLARAAVSA